MSEAPRGALLIPRTCGAARELSKPGGLLGPAGLVTTCSGPLGLPWWSSGLESAFQSRERGFPGQGTKIPNVTEQLSPCAATRDKPSRHSEEPTYLDEGARVLQLTPGAAKIKKETKGEKALCGPEGPSVKEGLLHPWVGASGPDTGHGLCPHGAAVSSADSPVLCSC